MDFTTYINEELLILVPMLYIVGKAIKTTEMIDTRFIPSVLMAISIFIASLHLISMNGFSYTSLINGIVHGVLVSGVESLGYNIVREIQKK